VREKEHISMVRENPDGRKTPLTMPNHPTSQTPKMLGKIRPGVIEVKKCADY